MTWTNASCTRYPVLDLVNFFVLHLCYTKTLPGACIMVFDPNYPLVSFYSLMSEKHS